MIDYKLFFVILLPGPATPHRYTMQEYLRYQRLPSLRVPLLTDNEA